MRRHPEFSRRERQLWPQGLKKQGRKTVLLELSEGQLRGRTPQEVLVLPQKPDAPGRGLGMEVE